ncbi:Hypothetical protein, putative [Bodo saltans]|uniref:Uncharacterized protein n=1 Tax=Bodo saltans TaxID=75058 RepID=A0A0S4INE3_BODSA|nr:Hypothetical protein, putative [Bodo saltans]|eukprot:CUE85987.1 Hypothetical protein, putative [Bodo saltans]
MMRHHCSSNEAFTCIFTQETLAKTQSRTVSAPVTRCLDQHLTKRKIDVPVHQTSVISRRHVDAPISYHDDSEQQLPRLVHRQPRRKMPLPPSHCLRRDRPQQPLETHQTFHREHFVVPPKPSMKELGQGDALFKRIASLPSCTM